MLVVPARAALSDLGTRNKRATRALHHNTPATRPQHACNTHVQVLASLQFFLDQADTLSDTSAAAAGGRDVNAMYEEMKKDPKMQVPIRKCVRVRRAVGAVGSLGTGRGCAQCMRGWNVNVAHSSVCMAGM